MQTKRTQPSVSACFAIDARDQIGEGPVWDRARQCLLWLDHNTGVIHQAQAVDAEDWREIHRWELRRPLAAALPRMRGGLLVVGGTEIFGLDDAGAIAPFARIAVDPNRIRLNDAKCDPKGRLWATAFATDFSPCAALYRIDPDGTVTTLPYYARLANGLAWSPDGASFYFVDSLARSVDVFDFDLERGTMTNRRTCVTLARGLPNGISVDRQGGLWVAATGAGAVQRYTPDGEFLEEVTIATPAATSCAFGGPEGADLFITSRTGRLPEFALSAGVAAEMMDNNGPQAGGLFVCRPGANGAAATPFAG
jgi:sugar lactone lactonase YvrE